MPDALISRITSRGPGVGSGNSLSSSFRSPRKTTPLMTSSDALGFGPSGLEGRPGSPGAPRAPKSSIQHYGVAGRAGGADDAERLPDEGALVDLPVDQRLGVDVLQVPDAAAGLHLAVAGQGEVLSLLARRLGVARGGVAHGQRD